MHQAREACFVNDLQLNKSLIENKYKLNSEQQTNNYAI